MSRLAIVIAAIVLCVAGCGGQASQGPSDSGAVAFSVAWDAGSAASKVFMAPPPGSDVCSYYQITTINAQVTTGSGQHLTSASWPCSAHGGTISNVPVGVVNVIIEGVVGVNTVWRGQASGITVASGQTASAGTVTVFYVGNDVTRPTVQSTDPSNGATGVAQNASVSAVFSEDIVSASANTTSFTLTCGAAAVPGDVGYDSLSRTATFTPSSALPEATYCDAVITTGVEDLAGRQMASNYPWSFLTADLTAPDVVTGLTATAASSSQINLVWTPSTDNVAVTGYKIYRGGSFLTTATTTGYANTGLTELTQYCYTVSAIDAANNESAQSTQACATTQAPPLLPPTAPSGLTATVTSATSIGLSWTDTSNNETLFSIERSSTSGSTGFAQIATTAANAVIYSSASLSSSTTYWYQVRAYNTEGYSAYSNVATATTPLQAPTSVTATAGNQQNTIAWLDVPGATSYNLYWSTVSGVTRSNGTRISGVSNPYAHTGLTNWVRYYYVVTAVNALGESFESQEVSAMPRGASGTLDNTFNTQGWVVHSSAAGANGSDVGRGIAIDSSGRLLVVGSSMSVSTQEDMVIWRYNPTGALDTTFNGVGFVVHNNAAGGNSIDMGYGITLDSSGRILVVGGSWSASGPRMVIWRYNTNGTLDTSFNGLGYVVQSTPALAYHFGNGITTDSSGRILVTGYMYNLTLGNNDMAIWRLNANGTLDTTFNGTGYAVHHGASGGNYHDNGSAITVDSSGRPIVAGYSRINTGYSNMVIWRYTTSGTLDATFNGTGYVVRGIINYFNGGNGIALDTSGRLLVTGSSYTTGASPATYLSLYRYNSNGTSDTSFAGGGGAVFTGGYSGGSNDSGNPIVVDANGKILVTGNSNSDMTLWRYNTTGSLDTTFNAQGYAIHNNAAGGSGYDTGYAIKLDSLGRILITGSSIGPSGNNDMVIWRYNP